MKGDVIDFTYLQKKGLLKTKGEKTYQNNEGSGGYADLSNNSTGSEKTDNNLNPFALLDGLASLGNNSSNENQGAFNLDNN
ncbi:MAG: hypothetical protein AABY10_03550, partial [Nanoarchaeota archaeon]